MGSARGHAVATLVLAVVAGAGLGAAPSSSAQDNPLIDALTTTTTSPKAPGTSTTTTSAPIGAGAAPAPSGAPGAGGGDGATPPAGGIVVPPEAQKIINSVQRTPPSNDVALVAAVHQLVDLGMSQADAFRVGMGRLPVAGTVHYSDDWLEPRYGPGFRFHLGCDVFADYGTPIRAPVDGVATSDQESLGGLTVRVAMPDGTYFYLAHLSSLVAGFANGMPVTTGDIVGYVGDSGNAKGGAAHVHVGIYPRGGPPVDPKPILDQFLVDATNRLPSVVAAYQAAHPTPTAVVSRATESAEQRLLRPALATAFLHHLAAGALALGPGALYLLANDPIGGGHQLVQGELDDLAASIDWSAR